MAARTEPIPNCPCEMCVDLRKPEPAPADPWVHRSAGMRCRTCIWYVPKSTVAPSGPREEIGRCRRHAPTMNGYPVVYPSDWCGDHRVDENRL